MDRHYVPTWITYDMKDLAIKYIVIIHTTYDTVMGGPRSSGTVRLPVVILVV